MGASSGCLCNPKQITDLVKADGISLNEDTCGSKSTVVSCRDEEYAAFQDIGPQCVKSALTISIPDKADQVCVADVPVTQVRSNPAPLAPITEATTPTSNPSLPSRSSRLKARTSPPRPAEEVAAQPFSAILPAAPTASPAEALAPTTPSPMRRGFTRQGSIREKLGDVKRRFTRSESSVAKGQLGGLQRVKTSNSNRPGEYTWLEDILNRIVSNQAHSLGCVDTVTGKAFTPIFLVVGACPNMFCGMQVVMYCVNSDGDIDFWWVKPGKGNSSTSVEPATLNRHMKGPHKNDPGRSKQFYKPLADLFTEEGQRDGVRFGVEAPPDDSQAPRAFLEEESPEKGVERRYLHLVWQEDWSSNPFARSRYIKGKVVYQKSREDRYHYARQYSIIGSNMIFSGFEDEATESCFPGDELKELWE